MPQPSLARTVLRRSAAGAAALGVVGGLALLYARAIEPNWTEVRQVRLALPRLDPAFDGYRIAQISDIHMDAWMDRERLGRVVRLVNRQRPDLIAITGDFVTREIHRYARDLTEGLGRLRARDGVAAVLGNHDYRTDDAAIRRVIAAAGLLDLDNAVHTLRRGAARLHLAGVDDVCRQRDRLDRVLSALPADGAAILLAHEPDFADISAATGRFDVQLSGHSHGGQVALPGIGPLAWVRLARKYPRGLYQVEGMRLYTNRGIGSHFPRVRFSCRPEITIFTLAAGRATVETFPKRPPARRQISGHISGHISGQVLECARGRVALGDVAESSRPREGNTP